MSLSQDEISARTGFAGNRLWRDGEQRTEESLASALAHDAAIVYLTAEGKWLCAIVDGTPMPGFTPRQAETFGASLGDSVLLGFEPDGRPALAAEFGGLPDPDSPLRLIELRSVAMQGALGADVEGRLGQAAHLLNWHRKNRFCGQCGGPTVSEAAGYRRRCTRCGEVVFPRTDPVTIMLVHDGNGACVLGRQPRFPEKFWSCLAGFVEAGETVEDAVRRETKEESGLDVGSVTYLASQPWPFPGSLMIGCIGLATNRDISFDGEELEACRWFDRDEVRTMLDGTHAEGLTAPSRFAIAHHLIKAFAEGDLVP
ncbi:NAD(+) diphosphatase [Aurantimonas sp. VKM B-3413]|uniref:NAD(+) diphosphatase n=1 Tax=Aurantimonas sp. VKM B-3413 TaxID=2779401 RepID=UPI001E5F4375|nr:NAD(+) diphosphatase [Aurantimonas sp. VKM B-3413]MCB8837167.1 NAD(+) diphosphatase [Aurantimonas sp. VKM B-3413]